MSITLVKVNTTQLKSFFLWITIVSLIALMGAILLHWPLTTQQFYGIIVPVLFLILFYPLPAFGLVSCWEQARNEKNGIYYFYLLLLAIAGLAWWMVGPGFARVLINQLPNFSKSMSKFVDLEKFNPTLQLQHKTPSSTKRWRCMNSRFRRNQRSFLLR